MKIGWMALLLLLPLAFSSCLSSSGSETDPLSPGASIYNAGRVKNQLALVPTDVAIRLAILLHEADTQGTEPLEATYGSDLKLVDYLFPGSETIEQENGVYTFTFPTEDVFYYYSGKVIVDTGNKLLDDESADAFWQVTVSGLKARVNNGYNSVIYTYEDNAVTEIYPYSYYYHIDQRNFSLASSGDKMLANWSGGFDLQVADLSFNYNHTDGKGINEFTMSGSAGDAGLTWSMNNVSFRGVTISSASGDYIVGALQNGTITAKLQGTYDTEVYPDPTVKVEWTNNGTVYTITWNNMTASYSGN